MDTKRLAMWTEQDVPEDYLLLAKKLVTQQSVTKAEFIDLCKLAIDAVESRNLTSQGKGNMFVYIANLWFRHDNIDDGSITNDIGGQFADWEVPGTLNLDYDVNRKQWELLKSWVAEADKKYGSGAE